MAPGSDMEDEAALQAKASKRKRTGGSDSDMDLDDEPVAAAEEAPKKKKAATKKAAPLVPLLDVDDPALIEDEEDAARLAKMTELEREMELAERADRLNAERQRQAVMAAAEGKAPPKEKASAASRRSGREVREETAKRSAIEEIKAARRRVAQGRRAHDAEDYDEEEEDEDAMAGAAGSDAEEGAYELEGDEYDEDECPGGLRWAPRATTEADEAAAEPADFAELQSIQVRRHRLEEWLGKPFFAEALSGCMVRVVAGEERTPDGYVALDASGRPQRRYMLARVVGVQEMPPGRHKYLPGTDGWKSPYPFGPDGTKTALWLRVSRGGSERPWPMAQVSNSSFTEAEHASWVRACESANERVITRGDVADAAARLSAAADYVYTAEDVARLLEEKRAKGQGARNVALERARLERERDAAAEAGDGERVAEAEVAIAALEEAAAAAAASRAGVAASMAALNRKNAAKNFQSALKAGVKDGTGGAAAASTLDPFSRRATRTKNYWNTQRGGEGANGGAEGDGAVLTEAEKLAAAEAAAAAATQAAQAAAAAAAAAPTLVDLSELDLSLLDLPPRVAPLARKLLGAARGRAAVVPAAVPAGAKAVSLSEYKRRSGMP